MQRNNTQKPTKILTTNETHGTKLNALIITHEDKPIRPVINNIQAPPYKLAKYLSKKLNQLIKSPYTHATRNSMDLSNIRINNQHLGQKRPIC
jgi:hypothetical protein